MGAFADVKLVAKVFASFFKKKRLLTFSFGPWRLRGGQ
jgi:hypothetical protein